MKLHSMPPSVDRSNPARGAVPATAPAAPVGIGKPFPIGASVEPDGTNFCTFSRTAGGIDLLLFDREDDARPARVIPLDPVANRSYHYWHAFVPGVRPGQIYGYRARGAVDPAAGLRFDPSKVLLDPYGRGVVVPEAYDRNAAAVQGRDVTASAMKSVVVDPSDYDWEDDEPLRLPAARTIIYEMHVGGFTKNPNSGVGDALRGTYAGLVKKIPYLKDLGITAVELLPVFEYDAQACPPGVVNYWGYQPVSFFAPHRAYSSRRDVLGPITEFRDMVKALHRAGIEVILDVVFNHTAEGDATGPTFCFRGLDNPTYYILAQDKSQYADFSGCQNTLSANNPIVRRMIVDSVRYWVEEMHVDGFRFDLASILSRDPAGNPMPEPPVLWDLESDPTLAGTKLIAEAWDAAGLYQVGHFIGDSWREWNGRFRDDARTFFRGDHCALRRFADRLVGSPEVYQQKQRDAEQSINFVTCHDGFTMNDLVSYDRKHNESNNDGNRDGSDDNMSWNCGVEGPTDDPAIEALRNRQVKNYLAVTMLSIGIPMLLMGDEVRRTQHGNNNGYCHDDESTWFDWTSLEKHADVHRFVKLLCARRVMRSAEHERRRLTLAELIQRSKKSWHGVKLNEPDWGDSSRSIAFTVELQEDRLLVHVILNAYSEALDFQLAERWADHDLRWRRWIDTSLRSPDDIAPWQDATPLQAPSYRAGSRSVVVLFAPLGDVASAAPAGARQADA